MLNQIKNRQFIPGACREKRVRTLPFPTGFSAKLKKRSGQALTELAIFGSLFLFSLTMLLQFALNFSYKQEMNMLVFRRALAEANELYTRGQSSQIVSLQDKTFPDAQDPTGVPQHYPVMAGASVMWSNQLMFDYTNADLPRMVMDVNGQQILPNQGGATELRTAGLVTYAFNRTTATSKYIHTIEEAEILCQDSNGYPLPIYECPDLYGGGSSWKWAPQRNLLLVDTEVSNNSLIEAVLVASLQTKAQDIVDKEIKGQMADVDSVFNADGSVCQTGDCKTEQIISVTIGHDEITNSSPGKDRHIFYVNAMSVYDYQRGGIDVSYNSRDENAGVIQQGIQPGYTKRITSNSAIAREENVATEPTAIKTIINTQATDTINRTVQLNDGDIENISSQMPTSAIQEWVTPND